MKVFSLILNLSLLIVYVTDGADSTQKVNNDILKELFKRASIQSTTTLMQNLFAGNHIFTRSKRSAGSNFTDDGQYEKYMTEFSDESQIFHTSYRINLKVVHFLKGSPQFNEQTLNSSLLRAPAEFCPFSKTTRCFLTKYRTLDGSCNNPIVSLLGKSETPYKRYLQPEYEDNLDLPRSKSVTGLPLPNPRLIAMNIHHPRDSESILSNLGVSFGQFIDHDFAFTAPLTNPNGTAVKCHCNSSSTDCINIKTPRSDSINSDQECMKLSRSGGTFKNLQCDMINREQLNKQTHFLDLSQLYGNSDESAERLRTLKNGRLKSIRIPKLRGRFLAKSKRGTCSQETDSVRCFESGDKRTNQNLLLVGIHTIWMREHNRIARELKRMNRHWNDETLFQEARRINTAIYQNIIYSEWLPTILGEELIEEHNLRIQNFRYFFGYNPNGNPSVASEFSSAAFRFGHSMVNSFYAKCDQDLNIFENMSLTTLIFKPTEAYVRGGLDSISRGLLFGSGNRMDSHVTDAIQNRLFENKRATAETHRYSLPAVNIMRGRDHGLPGYNKFRELAGLRKALDFNDLIEIPADVRRRLSFTYAHVDDIDAFTGGISEANMRGSLLGPTFSAIVARQFKELKEGDQFYFENGHNRLTRFTGEQMEEIKKVTMASVMCNNLDLNVIQMRAFRRLQNRREAVDCARTPFMDLEKWRDEPIV